MKTVATNVNAKTQPIPADDGLIPLDYDDMVVLIYGFEIEHEEPDVPELVWHKDWGTLHYFNVDYAGTTNQTNATVIGKLLAGLIGLHYSSCVRASVPIKEDKDMLKKFKKANASLLPKNAEV